MSTRKGKVAERVDDVVQAEEIAASVDSATARVVDELKSREPATDIAEGALESAAMVAEGGPVDDQTAVDSVDTLVDSANEDTDLQATAEAPIPIDELSEDDGPVGTDSEIAEEKSVQEATASDSEESAEPKTGPAFEIPAESLAAAAIRNNWGPVPDPLEPGPGNPSPDGTILAFLQAHPTSETRLWFYAIDGSSRRSMGLPFTPVVDEDGPQWSPDGLWLAMAGSHYPGGPTAIWLAPIDGGECVVVARHEASDRQPRWSPDGSLIAFVSQRDSRDTICVALPTGDGPVIQLTWGLYGQNDREPCWSDDSSRIAFLRSFAEGDASSDQVWTVSITSGETKQATKKVAKRQGLRWNPGKTQVGFITDEGEWLNVGVVNPDNSAGWNLASEAGDKGDPRYTPDGARMLYTRGLKGEVRLGERATSGASAELLDPGMGVASSPRWLPGKRVVYRFSPATGSTHFIVQDAKKDAERAVLPAPVDWDAGRPLIVPTFVEFETARGAKLGGLFYRDPAADGLTPGVLVLPADPGARTDASFQPLEQSLAAAGFAVFTPILPGSPGLGKKLLNGLSSATSDEAETLTILDTMMAMREFETVASGPMAIVGSGYGGALALVLAGARPGSVHAAVAIDPVADWDDEFDQGSGEWREWQAKNFGLPTLQRGKHALRTPATFIGVVECPLLLIGTDRASEGRAKQVENLIGIMLELETPHEFEQATGKSQWEVGELTARFLREQFGPNRMPETEPVVVDSATESDRADDI